MDESSDRRNRNRVPVWLFGLALTVLLVSTSLYSYLLFHTLAELFSVIIAGGVFVVSWNTRTYSEDSPLVYIGSGYLVVAIIDLLHTISYVGMGVFPDEHYYANQLWIAARLLEAVILLLFLGLPFRRTPGRDRIIPIIFLLYGVAACFTIFVVPVFPVCFVAGVGQTAFKIASEYVIVVILVAALFLFLRRRPLFDRATIRLVAYSIALTIIEEILFTTYTDNYGVTNMLGHLAKILSFYLIYKAVIETNLRKPYETTFRSLIEHQNALESANRLKDRFLSIIGHDLRNPIGGIAEMTRLVAQDQSVLESLAIGEVMTQIHRSASESLNLLNNLLSWARSQTDSIVVSKETFDISVVVRSIVSLFDIAVRNKRLQLDADVPDLSVFADRNMITTVLRNLVSNAVKFTPRGGRIGISAQQTDGQVSVAVVDTGIGITDDAARSVLGDGLHTSTVGTEGESGTGLGLAVSRIFVEKNGGTLAVSSTPGVETVFSFSLPTAKCNGD